MDTYMSEKELYDKLIEKFGITAQALMLAEELGELVKAINKRIRGKTVGTIEISEEIADVLIMIRQMIQYFGIDPEDVLKLVNEKVRRSIERLKKGEI